MTTTAEEIENVLRANSYERDFFVRIETPHGEPALSSKRVTIVDIKKAAQALSEHSTKEQEVYSVLNPFKKAIETEGHTDGFKEVDWNENYMINIGVTVKEVRALFELMDKLTPVKKTV